MYNSYYNNDIYEAAAEEVVGMLVKAAAAEEAAAEAGKAAEKAVDTASKAGIISRVADKIKGGYNATTGAAKGGVDAVKGWLGAVPRSTAAVSPEALEFIAQHPEFPVNNAALALKDAEGPLASLLRGMRGLPGIAASGAVGGGIGALTNDGNRAAGAAGGTIGGALGSLLSRIPLRKLPTRGSMLGNILAGAAGTIGGGYGGGALAALADQSAGSPVTSKTNELLARILGGGSDEGEAPTV